MAFPTNPTDGQVRQHADGRRWAFSSTKGVWKIKNDIGPDNLTYKGAAGTNGTNGTSPTFTLSGTVLTITT